MKPLTLAEHLSELGKRGGKKRWKGVNAAKRRAHAMKMVRARRKNGSS